MLRKVELEPRRESFLSGHRIPELTFSASTLPYPSLTPVWEALNEGRISDARELVHSTMQERRIFPADERAALNASLAAAELTLGATDVAKRLAGRSLDLAPDQFMAHRIMLRIHVIRKDFTAAYLHLANLPLPTNTPAWDESISFQDVHVALSAWAWQLGEWDQVSDHLQMAYPNGLSEMPASIREDWFKLALYRGQAGDAAAAASSLIYDMPVDAADDILQTMIQSGWGAEALPLYQGIYAIQPENELIRRRVVGLCVKEGKMQEARTLAMVSPLKMAA